MTDEHRQPYDPAGTRPKVDADALAAAHAPVEDLPWAEREDRAERALEQSIERLEETHVEEEIGDSEHIGRFQFILGGLIAVGVIAIAAIVIVIVAGRTDTPEADWSAWRPSGDDTLQQIADHVGATYRNEYGQLALVLGSPLQVDLGGGDIVGARLARQDPKTGDYGLEKGKTALFSLCGAGADCTFAGKSSDARLLLVHREALELALYAMRYTDADQVVVTFPTYAQSTATPDAPAQIVPTAVLVHRDDVRTLLDAPLSATLASPVPSLKAIATSAGMGQVARLTGSYAYQVQRSSNLGVLYVLGNFATALEPSSVAPGTTTVPQATTTPQTATTTTPQTTTTTPPTTTTPQRPSKGKSGQRGG